MAIMISGAVAVLPAASRASALTIYVPGTSVVVSHVRSQGALVTSFSRFVPFKRNCTPTTSTLSVAVACNVMVPDTSWPSVGLIIVITGGSVSGGAG